jgi:hypothetical protein
MTSQRRREPKGEQGLDEHAIGEKKGSGRGAEAGGLMSTRQRLIH